MFEEVILLPGIRDCCGPEICIIVVYRGVVSPQVDQCNRMSRAEHSSICILQDITFDIYQSSSGGGSPLRLGSSSSLLSSIFARWNKSFISFLFLSSSDMTFAAGINFFLAAVSVFGACDTRYQLIPWNDRYSLRGVIASGLREMYCGSTFFRSSHSEAVVVGCSTSRVFT